MSKKNLKEYTTIYENIDDTRKTVAEKYILELIFMEKELKKLKKEIENKGTTEKFEQGKQSMIRESPATKAYCAIVQRYGEMQRKLLDMLPDKKDTATAAAGEKLVSFLVDGKAAKKK